MRVGGDYDPDCQRCQTAAVNVNLWLLSMSARRLGRAHVNALMFSSE